MRIVDVAAVDCAFEPQPWGFASDRAAEIEAHWAEQVRRKPALFNGRVLLMHRGAVEHDADGELHFRGAYLEADFKAFLAWRDFGAPPTGIRNGFGMAALSSADGAFILGEMAAHTANAGRIYFASGTPDPTDIVDGQVDIEGSVRRELDEETGIGVDEVSFDPGMTLVIDDLRVGFMKRVRSPLLATELVERIHAFLAQDPNPELARMHIVRTPADIAPQVQSSCAAYLRSRLA